MQKKQSMIRNANTIGMLFMNLEEANQSTSFRIGRIFDSSQT